MRKLEDLEDPTVDKYSKPGWEYALAHHNGQKEELLSFLRLTDQLFES